MPLPEVSDKENVSYSFENNKKLQALFEKRKQDLNKLITKRQKKILKLIEE